MSLPEPTRAERATCGFCWQVPGLACGPGWDHLDRYLRASRRGLISHAEVQQAVHASDAIDGEQVVRFGPPGG